MGAYDEDDEQEKFNQDIEEDDGENVDIDRKKGKVEENTDEVDYRDMMENFEKFKS